MNPRIKGVIVPLLTPFDDHGGVDFAALRRLVNFLIERGIKGLFPVGTTGEGPLLTKQERRQLAEAVVEAADGRVPVIVHTGSITTKETIDLTKHAQEIGAQAAAIIPPYFFHYQDQALYHHFVAVASAVSSFPIYLYNNPGVGGSSLSLELVTRLVEERANIVGMKDSSGSLEMLTLLSYKYEGFNTANGGDGQILMGAASGIDACVSGNANVVPELVVALQQAAAEGKLEQARKLQRQMDQVRQLLEDGRDLAVFKGVLARPGLPVGTVRRPLLQASEAVISERWQALSALNLELNPIAFNHATDES
jgi:4-hydroxy-tetrahydrodipicolinate synthase